MEREKKVNVISIFKIANAGIASENLNVERVCLLLLLRGGKD